VRLVYDINLGDSRAAFIDSLGAALHISDRRRATCKRYVATCKRYVATCKRYVTPSFEKWGLFLQND
jgi:hypothetical protein